MLLGFYAAWQDIAMGWSLFHFFLRDYFLNTRLSIHKPFAATRST